MLTQLRRSAQMLLIPLLIVLTGCENNNLFSKLSGDSSDPATLSAQANIALRERDYSRALSLANQVLAQDPNNSQALSIAAAAAIGGAGFNLGTLVSNVLGQVGSSGLAISGMGGAIGSARERLSSSANCGGADSIIAGLDCTRLLEVLPLAICRLQKIVSGAAHGAIPRTDVATKIDLAILRVMRAALLAATGNYLAFKNQGGDFTVEAGSASLDDLCNNDPQRALTIVKDVAGSYNLFKSVASQLNLSPNSLIRDIQTEVDNAGEDMFNLLPASCVTLLSNQTPSITPSNYLSVLESDAFTAPTGC